VLKYDKRNKQKNNKVSSTIAFLLSATVFAFIISKINITKLVFGEIKNETIESESTKKQIIETKKPIVNDNELIIKRSENNIYRYEDEKGTIVMVSDPERVPQQFRGNMIILKDKRNEQQNTEVTIKNNQVYVPVEIGYQGKTVNVKMLVDTGCTGISISPSIAQKLGIQIETTRQSTSTIANGTKTTIYNTTADFVTVGPKTKRLIEMNIMPRNDVEETGLLGMSFLKDFPHMIDMKSQTIKWM